jgi:hypothetical protein
MSAKHNHGPLGVCPIGEIHGDPPWCCRNSRFNRGRDSTRPSVLRHNLQCQPVRGVNFREECHWSHACKSFKRTYVGTNDILECKILSENAHRTQTARPQSCCQSVRPRSYNLWPYSIVTGFTAPTGKKSGLPRGMPLVTRMIASRASRRRIQLHPRV